MKIVDNFIFFWGGWLSNFHPCRIVFGSKVFKSSEQLFMYHFGDIETAERILLAETPKEAKTLGREVRNFDEKSWNEVKIQKMYLALEGKFSQNKDLMDKLKDPALNGKFFVEASPFDRVWGMIMHFKTNQIGEKIYFTENLYKQFADIDIVQYPLYF